MVSCCVRCYDRKCSIFKKANRKDKGCDKVNTRKVLQSELQKLYTGPQIESFYVYSQLFTNLWACLMYSSGLPILYLVSCLFYFILYWVYKILLLKFYQRTVKFNEGLAVYSIKYIKYGVFFHMVIGGIMYSNSRIMQGEEAERLADLIERSGSDFLDDRFDSAHSQLYAAIFVLVVFLYFLYQFLDKLLVRLIYNLLFCQCFSKQRKTFSSINFMKSAENSSDDILRELLLVLLVILYLKNQAFHDFVFNVGR